MKQAIIMVAMVALGVTIFKLIAGGGEGTVISVIKDVWEHEIEMRTGFP